MANYAAPIPTVGPLKINANGTQIRKSKFRQPPSYIQRWQKHVGALMVAAAVRGRRRRAAEKAAQPCK